jgi:hypothetical protein
MMKESVIALVVQPLNGRMVIGHGIFMENDIVLMDQLTCGLVDPTSGGSTVNA